MKRILFAILSFFISVISLKAQEKESNIYINGGAGMHNMQYDLKNGSSKGSMGYTFNLGYNYFFSSHWGIGTGIGIQYYSSTSTLNYMDALSAIDTDNDSYKYRIYYQDLKEEQNILLFDIPVGFSYRKKLTNKLSLQTTVGGKISLPINAKYKVNSGTIETRGYYSQYNVELYGLPQHGFTTHSVFSDGDISLNTLYSAFVDFGILYPLSNKTNLYIGGYLNYGVNNMINATDKLLFQKDGTYNGVYASNQTDNVSPMAFGIKLGLTWRGKTRNKTTNEETKTKDKIKEEIKNETKVSTPKEIMHPTEELKIQYLAIDFNRKLENEIRKISQNRKNIGTAAYSNAKQIASEITLRFNLNSNNFENSEDEKIKKLAQILKANPAMKVYIVGHTSDTGSRKMNMKIGMERAKAVKTQIVNYGVWEEQLVPQSKGADEPLVPNSDPKNRAKNQRVQLLVK